MKKVILMVLTIVLSFTMFGCDVTTTTTERDTSARELLFEVIDEFNGLLNEKDYEDLTWYDDGTNYIGYGNIVAYSTNEIELILFDNDVVVMLSIFLDDSDSLHSNIYEIDINYIDYENNIYISVWYCYQASLLHSYMDNYQIDINYNTLLEKVQTITKEDVQWLLIQLDYPLGE